MRSATILLSILSVLLLSVCGSLYSKTRRDATSLDTLRRNEQATRSRYERVVQEISAIQDSVSSIAVDAGLMNMTNLGAERRLSPTGASETLARIAELRTRIEDLETRLRLSDFQVAGLDNMVRQLKQGLAQKEQAVARLGVQVETLKTRVADLTTSVDQAHALIAAQSDTLEQARRELGTVYYVMGTRQALIKNGVVAAQGGVLGVGKTLRPTGKVDPAALHAVDTDEQTVIPIAATKARVITAQAPQSYSIEAVNGGLELHILDPVEFRKVRQLVIITA
jgi:predicted nuclease with TOPRIM domain